MADLILHHYATSPYSEKIRLILGYKKLPWKSVTQPPVMPKPDQVALTGGYRKAPVLQIGADIYCDTKLIVRVLERLQPMPALLRPEIAASVVAFEQWTEQTLFNTMVPAAFQPQGLAYFFNKMPAAVMGVFQQDRAALFAGGAAKPPSGGASRNELPVHLAVLEAQLGGPPYLLGAAPTLADFTVHHLVWFVLGNPGVASTFAPYPNIRDWAGRINAIGHGSFSELSAEQAIQIARNSEPLADAADNIPDPNGVKLGDAVAISAIDYGCDPVRGVLVKSTLDEVALKRSDPRAGDVVVHFPRVGFKIAADKK